MADTPTFSPNPYANFDPSQWTNPYSQFSGKALPWPSSYAGMPTNALGQPIATPPGITLNSTPAAAPQAPDAASGAQFPTGSPLWQAQQSGASPAKMQAMFGQMSPTIGGQTKPNDAPSLMAMMGGAGAGGQAAPQAAAGGAPDRASRPTRKCSACSPTLARWRRRARPCRKRRARPACSPACCKASSPIGSRKDG